jgi:MoaA/NifB/PqqE/SkfB family radical SAM enzyme
MIPQVLAFITTYRCNFSCDHCSVSAGPDRREVLAADVMRRAIEQAYALPSIRVIVFGFRGIPARNCRADAEKRVLLVAAS